MAPLSTLLLTTWLAAAPLPEGWKSSSGDTAPEGAARVAVLVPDLGTTPAWFLSTGKGQAGLAELLTEAGVPWVAVAWPKEGAGSLAALELGLVASLNTLLPKGDLLFVGWGWGGGLALDAAAGPLRARTAGFVSLDAVAEADVPSPALRGALNGAGTLDLAALLAAPAPLGKGSGFELWWSHGAPLAAEESSFLLARGFAPLSAGLRADWLGWMDTGRTTLASAYPAALTQLTCPVLLVTGLTDGWSNPEFAAALRDHIPRGRVKAMPISKLMGFTEDVGHAGLLRGDVARTEVLPPVVTWLKSHAGGAR